MRMTVMDFNTSASSDKCCDCACSSSTMGRSLYGTWFRSVKRKFDEVEEDENRLVIPGLDFPHVARVETENERDALREMVNSQQQTIQDLILELEEERNAASTAANEAMSMILRLQREKAEIQMEARQFKRLTEEKMAHDQQELSALEDLLYKREQAIQSLYCEVQAYKHRMLSFGLTESEIDVGRAMSQNNSLAGNLDSQPEFPPYNYPPLKCNSNENQGHFEVDNDVVDVEKYAFGETPRSLDHLKDLDYRINQLERTPRHIPLDGDVSSAKSVFEKVIVGQSPRPPRHFRRFSTESSTSFFATAKEIGQYFAADSPRFAGSFRKMECSQTEDFSNLRKVDNVSEAGDDLSDRIYTIDSVQGITYNGFSESKPTIGASEDYLTTPRQSMIQADAGDPEITKLYMRLQALEADRESMRQALISMRTDKAQLVLLKEIAQNLCKEMSPAKSMPLKKQSLYGRLSFTSVFKWIVSFVLWRKKALRSKYMFGMSTNNAGLLILLDKGPRIGQWRCLSSTRV
ncbi:myosin-binding protein 7-like [Diospyros lotus]|uniref:myosin-binding protein 7-like n=1 Tax=Diospyros lotus TaxID=55363 RepID=UPI0022584191|nr:myosin-binding protein 7-like [Diospyros lotus]